MICLQSAGLNFISLDFQILLISLDRTAVQVATAVNHSRTPLSRTTRTAPVRGRAVIQVVMMLTVLRMQQRIKPEVTEVVVVVEIPMAQEDIAAAHLEAAEDMAPEATVAVADSHTTRRVTMKNEEDIRQGVVDMVSYQRVF